MIPAATQQFTLPAEKFRLEEIDMPKELAAAAPEEVAMTETSVAPIAYSILARICFESGKRPGGEKLLQEIIRSGKAPYEIAKVYAGLGQNSDDFKWLTKAVSTHDHNLPAYIRLDPWFSATIRSDPRFAQILRQVDLP